MKSLKTLGLILFAVSAIGMVGYGVFQLAIELFNDTSTPLILKLGILGMVIGVFVILIALIVERLRDKSTEKFSL